MSFANTPQVFSSLSVKDYIHPVSFDEYKEQIVAYFSGRSCNAGFMWDMDKLKERFKNACQQVERFIDLPEKG